MTAEQLEKVRELVWDAFNAGISCGHSLTTRSEFDQARKTIREGLEELRQELTEEPPKEL